MRIINLFMLLVLTCVFLIYSCTRNTIAVAYNYNLDFTSEDLPSGLSEYDSIVFSDGSIAVYRCGYAPCNSAMNMMDASGRLLATYAAASETYGQYLIYDYDDEGNISRIIEFSDGYEDSDEMQLWMSRFDTECFNMDIPKLRNRIQELDEMNFNSDFYTVYDYIYNIDGSLESVYTNNGMYIEADKGCKLISEVVPCPSFWESDLSGGHYHINIKQVPCNADMKNYIERVYEHMVLKYEMDYMGTKPIQLRIYNTEGQYQKTVFSTIENGINVYTHTYAGLPERKVEYWKECRKQKEETISIYGTVFTRKDYSYLPNGDVIVKEFAIDFHTRKLNQKSVYVISLDDLHEESFIMNGEEIYQSMVDGHSL